MTAIQPRRQGPSAPVGGPAVSLARTYRLYRFYDEAGALLYVGITGRLPFKRLMEHVCDKPWAPEMARWEVDPRAWATEAEVLAAEKVAIINERPKWNIAHNGNNPVRAATARPAQRWRPSQPVLATPTVMSRVLRSPVTWWLAAWLVTSSAMWWALGRFGVVLPWPWHLGLSAATPVVLVLAGWWWWAKVGRRWRRQLVRLLR